MVVTWWVVACLTSVSEWTTLFALISDDCGTPDDRDFATASFNFTWYNNTANFTCDESYAYSDYTTWKEMTCQEDGSWNTIDDNCRSKHCLIPIYILL